MFNSRLTLKPTIYLAFSLITTATVFWWLLRKVSFSEVLDVLRHVDLSLLLTFFVMSFSMSLFRTWRFLLLLGILGVSISRVGMFLVVLVRNFFSDLLPARIGTLVYVYIVTNRLGVSIGAAGASFGVAFIFDIFALLPLGVLAFFMFPNRDQPELLQLLLIIGLVGAAAYLLLRALPYCCRLASRTLATLSATDLRIKAAAGLEAIGSELERIYKSGVYPHIFLLSVLVRVFKYASLYLFLCALLKPMGYTFAELNPAKAFIGICAAELAASLPISGIAGFGAYEGAWAAAFSAMGYSSELAALTAISHHLFTQVYGYLLGLAALLMLLFIRKAGPSVQGASAGVPFSRFLLRLGVVTCLLSSLAFLAAHALPQDSPVKPVAAAPADCSVFQKPHRLEAILGSEAAEIVFDSNRSGTFGIYRLNLKTGLISTIVDSAVQEMYPYPSPDGEHVVFARAQSTMRRSPSSIWLVPSNGGLARKVAENCTFPSFTADGNSIIFERERKRVIRVNLQTGKEQHIFPAADSPFADCQIVKPQLAENSTLLAFTSDCPSSWNAWSVNLIDFSSTKLGPGCEPAWLPDNRLAWIRGSSALAGSGIFVFSFSDKASKILRDADGPLGHEYFPSPAARGELLFYAGAPEEQHSHLTGNYQIFAANLKNGRAARLTCDSYTNRWPRLIPKATPPDASSMQR